MRFESYGERRLMRRAVSRVEQKGRGMILGMSGKTRFITGRTISIGDSRWLTHLNEQRSRSVMNLGTTHAARRMSRLEI